MLRLLTEPGDKLSTTLLRGSHSLRLSQLCLPYAYKGLLKALGLLCMLRLHQPCDVLYVVFRSFRRSLSSAFTSGLNSSLNDGGVSSAAVQHYGLWMTYKVRFVIKEIYGWIF
jgi:hypothetical protein